MRGMGPGKIGRVMSSNRQFVAVVVLLGLVVAFAPGSPAPSLLPSAQPNGPTAPQASTPAPTQAAAQQAPAPVQASSAPDSALPIPLPAGALPPPPPRQLPPECETDAIADLLDDVRLTAAELLGGTQIPGEALRTVLKVVAGCSENPDADLTNAIVSLALEAATLTDGIEIFDFDPIPLPDLRPLLLPVLDLITPDVRELLGDLLEPAADQVRSACGNLALISLLMAVFPEISPIPIEGDGLQQFLIPVSFICSLFDQGIEE